MGNLDKNEKDVIKFIYKREKFKTRLKEKSDGDCEFIQHGELEIGEFGISESDFIQILHELTFKGYIESSRKVHEFDTNEYILSWRLTQNGKNILSNLIIF